MPAWYHPAPRHLGTVIPSAIVMLYLQETVIRLTDDPKYREVQMIGRKSTALALAALAVLVLILLAACSDARDPGLSRAEVEEIVRAELAEAPQLGITSDEAERIARGVVAAIPPKSAPAEYTRFIVDNAISRYDTQGLDATIAYYTTGEITAKPSPLMIKGELKGV